MTKILELSDKDFKGVIIKMLSAITNTVETNENIESLKWNINIQQRNRRYKEEPNTNVRTEKTE